MNENKRKNFIKIKDLKNYHFDFIGDVHGCFKKLCQLLEKMGYKKDENGIYFHKTRKAFFLGDIVDGGPEVVKTFNLVKSMVEKGYATMILGNHEINLLAINTKYNGKYLRERSNSKLRQCKNSLDLILKENSKENMNFLRSIPLWIEVDSFRAIHACWHQESINILKTFVDKDNTLSEKTFPNIYTNKDAFDAMEKTLKGLELTLPEEYAYKDKYGKTRTNCRYLWWDKNRSVEERISIDESLINIPFKKYNDTKIVFFGHYWRKGTPQVSNPYAICLDYSVMIGGNLCAYRFDGEKVLDSKKLIFV